MCRVESPLAGDSHPEGLIMLGNPAKKAGGVVSGLGEELATVQSGVPGSGVRVWER